MPEQKRVPIHMWILYIAAGIGIAWLLARFLLPWLMPFLLALVTARLMEPMVTGMEDKFHIRRSFASVLSSTLVLSLIAAFVIFIGVWAVFELSSFVKQLPVLLSSLPKAAGSIEAKIYGFIIAAPVEAQEYLRTAIESVNEQLTALPGKISAWFFGSLAALAKNTPKFFLFTVTYVISVYFMSGSYPQIMEFLMRQIPRRWHKRVQDMKTDIKGTLGKWFKAQLMLMAVTFVQLAIGFLALRIDYAMLLAVLIAVIDALPVLGTGTILIPWAAVSIIVGEYSKGVWLTVIYGVVTLVHSFLEPKLVGGQLGLHPVATLIAMYLGFSAVGIAGMVTFPIALIILQHLNERGYLKLWK